MFLGIEIGGTKLQLGLGLGDGHIVALWRGLVNPAEGGEGIRKQIVAAVPELLVKGNVDRGELRGVGIGFGGPTDDATRTVIKSHQIAGWDGFPLADWVSDLVGVPAVLCNDADVAGLAEALFGAGKGMSPIFYVTVGTGIGGGFIVDGQIYRGVGRGAAEIGHLRLLGIPKLVLEDITSGRGIEANVRRPQEPDEDLALLMRLAQGQPITAKVIAEAARLGDPRSVRVIETAVSALADAVVTVITLLCPRRIVVGGGVSLIGDDLFFDPLRRLIADRCFPPFAGLTDIVPAALGEEVVVHGALALAKQKLGS